MRYRDFKYKISLLGFILILLTSCSNWLDVKPKTEEDADVHFETEEGFKSSLAGAYISLCQSSLYGRELTYGMVGVLGQEWTSGSNLTTATSAYSYFLRYNYTEAATVSLMDVVWSKMYNAIVSLNTILDYADQRQDVFTGNNYNIIKGEALALRAYIHFDLLRLYAGNDSVSMGKPSIPYLLTSKPQITAQSTPREVLTDITSDIDMAMNLLKVDPIYTGSNVSGVDNNYLVNRNFHMNYYATLALKARVMLYYGNASAALTAAKEVIAAHDGGLFPWVNKNDITTTYGDLRDRTFASEHIFALNTTHLEDYIKGYFTELGTSGALTARLLASFDVDDYRRQFFESDGGLADVFSKFWQMANVTVNGVTQRPKRDRMPMIRLSEMYYIAAECMKESNPTQALDYLNIVRQHRGLTTPLTSTLADDIQQAILDEYNKEFLGEGQVFYYHKRLGTTRIAVANAQYVLPMPETEIDLGQRQ